MRNFRREKISIMIIFLLLDIYLLRNKKQCVGQDSKSIFSLIIMKTHWRPISIPDKERSITILKKNLERY